MKKRAYNPALGYGIAATLLVVVFMLILAGSTALAYFVSTPKATRYTCAAFGSYKELLASFPPGEWPEYLDRNKDGIPCNSLYNKSYE